MIDAGLTLAVLSCGRFDLLRLTIESTLRAMSHPVTEILVTEDSGLPEADRRLDEIFHPWNIPTRYFVHEHRWGIFRCMDEIYGSVTTPYVLHLEDDWVCTTTSPDFAERSVTILQDNKNILQVWLRPPDDCNGHPLEDGVREVRAAHYQVFKTSFDGIWHGYSNNPNLRRLADYRLIPGGYAALEARNSGVTEARVGEFYFRKGFIAAVLCDPDGGFIHIGAARSTEGHNWNTPANLTQRFEVLRHRAIDMRTELQLLRKSEQTDRAPK